METPIDNRFCFFKGRVALYGILKAMNITFGDEIIVPGFTCVVVPNAITYLGAKPVYVDITPLTYNIDVNKIEEKISDRTRVIIAQHTFGIPADMERIKSIAEKYNLYVIEDSCHAIGSKYKHQEVGSFGDAAFFSSQWSKPITTGLGGWALVNNEQVRTNMLDVYSEFINPSMLEEMMLRVQYLTYSWLFRPSLFWFIQETYRWLSDAGLAIGSSSKEELRCNMPARFNKNMSRWREDLLVKKLAGIKKEIAHRKWVTSLYAGLLKEMGIKTIDLSDDYEPVFLRYPIRVQNKKKVLTEARRKRIEMGDWFLSPVHPLITGWEKVAYKSGMCPIADKTCTETINLPTHRGIGQKEVKMITRFLSEFVVLNGAHHVDLS